jgi:hypothetical protein
MCYGRGLLSTQVGQRASTHQSKKGKPKCPIRVNLTARPGTHTHTHTDSWKHDSWKHDCWKHGCWNCTPTRCWKHRAYMQLFKSPPPSH